MARKRTWTDDDLKSAVKDSTNMVQVIVRLGLKPAGGTHRGIKDSISRLCIDTNHFNTDSQYSGFHAFRRPLDFNDDEVFCENSGAQQKAVRRLALRKNLLKYECSECGQQPFFREKELVLQLDHINGKKNDNRIQNLRFLCPNCHSQTETWGARNIKKGL